MKRISLLLVAVLLFLAAAGEAVFILRSKYHAPNDVVPAAAIQPYLAQLVVPAQKGQADGIRETLASDLANAFHVKLQFRINHGLPREDNLAPPPAVHPGFGPHFSGTVAGYQTPSASTAQSPDMVLWFHDGQLTRAWAGRITVRMMQGKLWRVTIEQNPPTDYEHISMWTYCFSSNGSLALESWTQSMFAHLGNPSGYGHEFHDTLIMGHGDQYFDAVTGSNTGYVLTDLNGALVTISATIDPHTGHVFERHFDGHGTLIATQDGPVPKSR